MTVPLTVSQPRPDTEALHWQLREYGWKMADKRPLHTGGQARIFRVCGGNAVGALKIFFGRKALLREYAVLRTIDELGGHEHILPLLDMTPCGIVTPYCANGDLLRRLEECESLPERQAVSLMLNLASAVRFLHGNRIAHLDIKPENVLFDDAGKPKLCDFGMAVTIPESGKCRCEWLAGTPLYVAPEVRGGREFECRAADIWSLGVCAYVMVVGRMPYRDAMIDHLVAQGHTESALAYGVQRVKMSSAYMDTVDGCLQLDAARRTTADELVARAAQSLALPAPSAA